MMMVMVIMTIAPTWRVTVCQTVSSRRSGLAWRAIEIPVDRALIDWIGAHFCVNSW